MPSQEQSDEELNPSKNKKGKNRKKNKLDGPDYGEEQLIKGDKLTPEVSLIQPITKHFEKATLNTGKKFKEIQFPNSSLIITLSEAAVVTTYFVNVDRSMELKVFKLDPGSNEPIRDASVFKLDSPMLNTKTPLCANLQQLSQRQLFFYCMGAK